MSDPQEDLLHAIRGVLAASVEGFDVAALDPDADLFSAGILDSFRVLTVLMELEKRFDIAVPDDALIPQNFWTLRALAATVTRLWTGQAIGR